VKVEPLLNSMPVWKPPGSTSEINPGIMMRTERT
jgi:hypothetical protein